MGEERGGGGGGKKKGRGGSSFSPHAARQSPLARKSTPTFTDCGKGGWCERGDSNPHGCEPLAPETSASTSSATFAAWEGSRFSRTRVGMSIGRMIFR